jgi:hypothetical protein
MKRVTKPLKRSKNHLMIPLKPKHAWILFYDAKIPTLTYHQIGNELQGKDSWQMIWNTLVHWLPVFSSMVVMVSWAG